MIRIDITKAANVIRLIFRCQRNEHVASLQKQVMQKMKWLQKQNGVTLNTVKFQ